jgi:putative acetyltransferase
MSLSESSPWTIETPSFLDHPQLVVIWERAVRATHTFFTEEDVAFFRDALRCRYLPVADLKVARDEAGVIVGFLGTMGESLDMLFVDPSVHGRGAGSALLAHGLSLGAVCLDVYEANLDARAFYEKRGFVAEGRLEVDSTGKARPLLVMRHQSSARR